jgi:hypothetical protein
MTSKTESMSEAKAGDTGPGQSEKKELLSNGNKSAEYQESPDYKDEIDFASLTDKDCLKDFACFESCTRFIPAENSLFCRECELSFELWEGGKQPIRDLDPFFLVDLTDEKVSHGLGTGTNSHALRGESVRCVPLGITAGMYSQCASYDDSEPHFLAKAGVWVPGRSEGELQIMMREPATSIDGVYDNEQIDLKETIKRVERKDSNYQSSQSRLRSAAKKLSSDVREAELEFLTPRTISSTPAVATRSSTFWEPRILSQSHAPGETYLRGLSSALADDYIAVFSNSK